MNPEVAKVPKRLHFPLEVTLICVRRNIAYPLSLRHLEEMMRMIDKDRMQNPKGGNPSTAQQFC